MQNSALAQKKEAQRKLAKKLKKMSKAEREAFLKEQEAGKVAAAAAAGGQAGAQGTAAAQAPAPNAAPVKKAPKDPTVCKLTRVTYGKGLMPVVLLAA